METQGTAFGQSPRRRGRWRGPRENSANSVPMFQKASSADIIAFINLSQQERHGLFSALVSGSWKRERRFEGKRRGKGLQWVFCIMVFRSSLAPPSAEHRVSSQD